jgi:hypothetical protein
MVLTSCAACDTVASAPFQSDNVPSFCARKRKPTALAVAPSQLLVKASSPEAKVAPPSVTDRAKSDKPAAIVRENRPPPATQLGSSSNKNKKKSSLQQMLERNREKERHKSKATDVKQQSGLSAFLSTL